MIVVCVLVNFDSRPNREVDTFGISFGREKTDPSKADGLPTDDYRLRDFYLNWTNSILHCVCDRWNQNCGKL